MNFVLATWNGQMVVTAGIQSCSDVELILGTATGDAQAMGDVAGAPRLHVVLAEAPGCPQSTRAAPTLTDRGDSNRGQRHSDNA